MSILSIFRNHNPLPSFTTILFIYTTSLRAWWVAGSADGNTAQGNKIYRAAFCRELCLHDSPQPVTGETWGGLVSSYAERCTSCMGKQRRPSCLGPAKALLLNTCRGLGRLLPRCTFPYRLWVHFRGQMVSPSPGGKPLLLRCTFIKRSQITLAALTKPHTTTWVSLIIYSQTLFPLAGGRTAASGNVRSNQQKYVQISGKDHTSSTDNHQHVSSVAGEGGKNKAIIKWNNAVFS